MTRLLGWLRIALIDLRGDFRRFAILIACLALGVGAIATIGSVGAALQDTLDRDARLFLGGDIEARLGYRPANADELKLFHSLGRTTEVVELNARATAGGKAAFLSLRAVDDNYPLVGAVSLAATIDADTPLSALLAESNGRYGAIVDSLMLDRLGLALGDQFSIGDQRFVARAVLDALPDQAARGLQLGATVLISTRGLAASGINGAGVLARYRYDIVLAHGDYAEAARAISTTFPDAGWELRPPKAATASFSRFFDLFERFLILVGLSSLLVGGVGVSNGVTAYITERQRSIATLRSLGATGARLLTHFLAQVLVLSGLAIVIGLVLGSLATLVLLPVLGALLELPLPPSLHAGPLLSAAAFGLLVAFAFAFLPLTRTQRLRPATLFRAAGAGMAAAGAEGGWRIWVRPGLLLPMLVALLALGGLAALTTREPRLVGWYAAGAIGAFLLLRAAAWLLQALLRRLPAAPRATIRHALGAIHRPGSAAPIVILSLGLGLSLLLLIALVETNLRGQLEGHITSDAPSFVLLNMQQDQYRQLEQFAATDKRIAAIATAPMLRGAITRIDGTPVTQLTLGRTGAALLRGDQSITWSARLPEHESITAGKWWPPDYKGKPLVSLDRDYQAPLDLAVGDTMEISILGRPITVTIASFRDIDVSQPGLSFPIIFSPGMIEAAPATLIGTIRAAPGAARALEATLVEKFPSLTFIPVGDVLDRISGLFANLANAVSIVGAIAVLSGVLVLAGALAAGRAQRQAEAVIMKVLGMTRGEVVRAFLVEYGLLGLLAALIAAALGAAAAWAMVTRVLKLPFSLDLGLLAAVLAGAMAITIATGLVVTWSALSTRPARYLREFD
jgi:putative ABC transport system permease protein